MSGQKLNTAIFRTELYKNATEIVEREYASDLTVGVIAQRIATSNRQLQRAFSEIGRTTFRDYLTKVRMRQAVNLLSNSDLKVAEVARRVGYAQPNYFSKLFHRYIGTPPTGYRKINGSSNHFQWPQSWQ